MSEDIYVYTTVRLPDGINEMVDSDGIQHTAYIDRNLTWEQQKEKYDHIVAHVTGGGWNAESADLEEVRAHGER